MMAERSTYPPMNIVVAEKQRSPPRVPFSAGLSKSKFNAASARSFASSITCSEIDDGESDISCDPFFEGTTLPKINDIQPGMPQRQLSLGALSLNSDNVKAVAEAAADAAPSLPHRQRSVASNSQQGYNDKLSDGSNSTTEPVPEYLQPAFAEEINSKIKQLMDQAELFKRVVDIRDRRYGVRTFKQCFVGSEAVDRMIDAGLASSRSEAVELGRNWIKYLGLFRHVTDGHDFKDRYLFYEFKTSGKNGSNNNNNKSGKKWHSAPPRTNSPWYSVRERDPTILEGQPMSQQDLMER